MGCTIFYNGTLKKKHTVNELFKVIIEFVENTDWRYEVNEDCLTIDFNDGKSELFRFKFKNHRMNDFCKVYSDDDVIYDIIFDMLYKILPMFDDIEIDDDYEIWNVYLMKKKL